MTPSLIIAAFQLTSGLFAHEPVGGGAAVPARASEACGGCHGAAFADWSGSGHASAWTSPLFRAGFQVEPRRFCVECHAPSPSVPPRGSAASAATRRARPRPAPGHVAALRSREELRSATACKDCHEFATPAFDDGAARTDVPAHAEHVQRVGRVPARGRR